MLLACLPYAQPLFPLFIGVAAVTFADLTLIGSRTVYAQPPAGQTADCHAQLPCDPMIPSPTIGPELPSRMDSGSAPSSKPSTDDNRWSSFLPLMADEAKKRGYQLPLPIGISTVVTGLFDRKINVTDVRAGVKWVNANISQSGAEFRIDEQCGERQSEAGRVDPTVP